MTNFKLHSSYAPSGDQPEAIKQLTQGIEDGLASQVLLGVTGSGKTFTMANIIKNIGRPTLVLAHNKTLAAQLCTELREFFPENRVEFFVSYYDYYQPESYIVATDTFIEKDVQINEEIDKLRHSATSSLMERKDVIVVASVSCIYGLGAPEEYFKQSISLRVNENYGRDKLIKKLIEVQYKRNDVEFNRSSFRVNGDVVEIFPSNSFEKAIRIEFFGDEIERICEINPVSRSVISTLSHTFIMPASHFVQEQAKIPKIIMEIKDDLDERVAELNNEGKPLEAYRLNQRVNYDCEMMSEMGYCQGIENYSRYFDGRKPGDAPYTLLDYFPDDFLLFIDESHMTIPQVRAMYNGDRARKDNLVGYGFRLPSAYDNRPLKFEEFDKKIKQVVYISATPAEYELKKSGGEIAEQIIRPTGLIDPPIVIRKTEGQIEDLIIEINKSIEQKSRVLITTLTKKMAEMLTEHLSKKGIKTRYLHSEILTLERVEILSSLRLGEFDVLVGINLLREGLDLPEVNLVAILDADKEGFLRSTTSLIQIVGRAARNASSKVIMYADNITDSMKNAIDETDRRRNKQMEYNKQHGIIPQTIIKAAPKDVIKITDKNVEKGDVNKSEIISQIEKLKVIMRIASDNLDFEKAIEIRTEIARLNKFID